MAGGMLERNLGTRLFNASQTGTAKRILFGQDSRCAIETRFVICSRGQDERGRAGTQSQVFDGRDVAVCTSPHRLCPPSPQPENAHQCQVRKQSPFVDEGMEEEERGGVSLRNSHLDRGLEEEYIPGAS